MSDVNRGFGAVIGAGVESTWGTVVARTVWKRVTSAGLRRTRSRSIVPVLGDLAQVSTNPRDFYVENDFAGGPISMPMAYDDATVLFCRHLLGANVDSGAGPFTHTQTLASPGQVGLSIEQISGTPASGGGFMAEVFEGCSINGGRISVEAGKLMMLDLDIIAETSQGLVAPGTPTYNTTLQHIAHQHAGTLAIGGTNFPVKSFAISVARNLSRNQELGSLLTQRPVEDRLDIEIDATVLWQQSNWDANYLADTQGTLTLTFTGTSNRALAITAHNVLVMDVSRPVSSAGGIQQSVKMKTFSDNTNQGLNLVFSNANATSLIN